MQSFKRQPQRRKGREEIENTMHRKLLEIINVKKDEVKKLKRDGIEFNKVDLPPIRNLRKALATPDQVNLIAEIKFASPSAGIIKEWTDPSEIAKGYESAGASAISLLTDEKFFQGKISFLPLLKRSLNIPVLRKDFIIDEVQVRESFVYGADAILLISRILSRQQLKDLIEAGRELGIAQLVEVHDREDIENAVDCGAEIIGINNRDLNSFTVDLNTTYKLAPLIPGDRALVCESGIENGTDIEPLKKIGIDAVLVGSALMKSSDPAKKAEELVKAGRGEQVIGSKE
ncbi:MAG: indole-3-glycerol phosphate synthase TrpC [Deltaproteobacteria bacterium]|nr:indole-3-glycerol phosphate synthase TrpC [Deltaproteobacteria bacterium]